MTDPSHIADEYVAVAKANNYLVDVKGGHSLEELEAAEQLLITRDNAANNGDETLNLALDLIERDIATARSA